MSYLSGVTSHADLGTAAVILPWHDPLRVAEQVAILDHLAKGRFRFGIGRGLSRREFAAFRGPIAMDESRERFDEAAPMILEALRTGTIEGNGKYYKQPRTAIRPKPARSFEGRTYAVASSEDSVEAAARLKARMVMFADRPWPMRLPQIECHRELFRKFHNAAAPPFLIADFCICTPTMDGTEELARRHMGSFVDSNLEHYEILSGHFSRIKGYDAYAKKAELAKDAGRDGIVEAFLKAAVCRRVGHARPHPARHGGTPRRHRRLRAVHLVPLWRHVLRARRTLAAPLCQGGAAGVEILGRDAGGSRGEVIFSRCG